MSNDFNDFMNTPDDTGMYDTQDIQTNKVWAALSYVGILFAMWPRRWWTGTSGLPAE